MRGAGTMVVAGLAVVLLVLGASPAAATEGPHTSCVVKESPLLYYKGEAWPGLAEKSPTEWWLTGFYVNITSPAKLPLRGDHSMTVKLLTVEGDDVTTRELHSQDVQQMINADNPLTENIWPWIAVPKNRSLIWLQTWVERDGWPKHCENSGLPF